MAGLAPISIAITSALLDTLLTGSFRPGVSPWAGTWSRTVGTVDLPDAPAAPIDAHLAWALLERPSVTICEDGLEIRIPAVHLAGHITVDEHPPPSAGGLSAFDVVLGLEAKVEWLIAEGHVELAVRGLRARVLRFGEGMAGVESTVGPMLQLMGGLGRDAAGIDVGALVRGPMGAMVLPMLPSQARAALADGAPLARLRAPLPASILPIWTGYGVRLDAAGVGVVGEAPAIVLTLAAIVRNRVIDGRKPLRLPRGMTLEPGAPTVVVAVSEDLLNRLLEGLDDAQGPVHRSGGGALFAVSARARVRLSRLRVRLKKGGRVVVSARFRVRKARLIGRNGPITSVHDVRPFRFRADLLVIPGARGRMPTVRLADIETLDGRYERRGKGWGRYVDPASLGLKVVLAELRWVAQRWLSGSKATLPHLPSGLVFAPGGFAADKGVLATAVTLAATAGPRI